MRRTGNYGTNENNSEYSRLKLTQREVKVLEFAAHGLDNKQIAENMYISSHTVKAHIASALKKLDAVNRTEAVYNAMKRHIIE